MRFNEEGRSMIEMLGVLAIVGVLSVGGIAGYSKAMNKFKTNKAIDQINMLSTNIRTLFSSQGNYKGMTPKLLAKAGVLPAEMYTGVDADNVTSEDTKHVFGGSIKIVPSDHNKTDAKDAYIIAVDSIPNSACTVMVSTDWGSDVGSGLAALYVDPNAASDADTAITALDKLATEITISAAAAPTTAGIYAPGDDAASTPLTIEAKLSSVKTILALSLAISVPFLPIAIPTLAFFKAGASLTPSPVIATTLPLA